MKYLVLLIDGMADLPIEKLDGKTPLEAAQTPCMDELASKANWALSTLRRTAAKAAARSGT